MKTIELSSNESERWDDTGAAGASFRRELIAREQERANRLGTSVEICHLEGHVLEVVLRECEQVIGDARAQSEELRHYYYWHDRASATSDTVVYGHLHDAVDAGRAHAEATGHDVGVYGSGAGYALYEIAHEDGRVVTRPTSDEVAA